MAVKKKHGRALCIGQMASADGTGSHVGAAAVAAAQHPPNFFHNCSLVQIGEGINFSDFEGIVLAVCDALGLIPAAGNDQGTVRWEHVPAGTRHQSVQCSDAGTPSCGCDGASRLCMCIGCCLGWMQ